MKHCCFFYGITMITRHFTRGSFWFWSCLVLCGIFRPVELSCFCWSITLIPRAAIEMEAALCYNVYAESVGGTHHIGSILTCACLSGCVFRIFGIPTWRFLLQNWVYFRRNILKSTKFRQNWLFFKENWYLNRW